MNFPSWFTDFSTSPAIAEQNFKTRLQHANNSSIQEIIFIFGRMNQQEIWKILPTLKKKIKLELKKEEEKFFKILEIAQKNLSEDTPVDLKRLNGEVYHLSAFSSVDLREKSISDIIQYLFSVPMPYQETCHWKCTSIQKVFGIINIETIKIEKTVQQLFSLTTQTTDFSWTLEDQQILYKYAVFVRRPKIFISWKDCLWAWAMLPGNEQVYKQLESHLFLHTLLPPKNLPLNNISSTPLFFEDYYLEATIHFLKTYTLLPSNTIEDEIRTIFLSVRSQQNAIFFIDYLHSLLRTRKNLFPFQEAVQKLNLLEKKSAPLYQILYTCIFFFYCVVKLSIHKSEHSFLFNALYKLNKNEKAFYSSWINENFSHSNFQLYSQFIQKKLIPYAKKHALPLNQVAHLILKFAIQIPDEEKEKTSKSNQSQGSSTSLKLTSQLFKIDLESPTLKLLFSPYTLLPSDTVEKELQEILSCSVKSQQDTFYFMEYIDSLVSPGVFLLEEAIKLLGIMFKEHSKPLFIFLQDYLLFVLCVARLSIETSHHALIFKAIHALSEDNKSFYHHWIYNSFSETNETFINETWLPFVKKHKFPLEDIAFTILKFAITIPNPNVKVHRRLQEKFSSLLDGEGHIALLELTDRLFGFTLPLHILRDFLLFRTATLESTAFLFKFTQIRSIIIDQHLEHLAIPAQLYQSWEEEATQFIGTIETDRELVPCSLIQAGCYPLHIMQFATFLQMSAYPLPYSPFEEMMPINITKENFIFDKKSDHHYLKLIHPDFTTGPARYCHWFFDPKTKEACFSVSIFNSLATLKTACTFHVPLKIPLSKPWLSDFCRLLSAFVDRFAKESLSEEDELKIKKHFGEYQIPDQCLVMEGSDLEIFDTLLSHSPLLRHLWNKNKISFGSDEEEVKIALYQFIKILRSSFKKVFFIALNDAEIESKLTPIEKESFHILHFNEKRKGSFLFDQHFFSYLYEEMEKQQVIPEEYVNNTNVNTSSFILKIENKDGMFQVTMGIKIRDKIQELPVLYPSFANQKEFLYLMEWQMRLLYFIYPSTESFQ